MGLGTRRFVGGVVGRPCHAMYVYVSIWQSSHGLEAEISVSYRFLCPARMLQCPREPGFKQRLISAGFVVCACRLRLNGDSRHEYCDTEASRWPQIQYQSVHFSKFSWGGMTPDPPSRECATKETPPPLQILDTPLGGTGGLRVHPL